MRPQRIHLYTLCWDEADMLGFFFRHYDPWVDRYVIYDDGSTDGSLDILRTHPKVDLRRFDRVRADSFCLSHQTFHDEAWKESRGQADWVIVTAIDEHLHIQRRDLAAYLSKQSRDGVTAVPALGFDMNHPELPPDAGRLVDIVTRGRPRAVFNKLSIFNPDAVTESGFGLGRHAAMPSGEIRLPNRDTLMLWHFKHLGYERWAEREARQAERLGTMDKAQGLGRHYLWDVDERRAFWSDMEAESTDLLVRDFCPTTTCVRPLWWEELSLVRAPAPIASPGLIDADRPPRVSVLVKSYNHAPYVRQTIESLLDQSFEDFEIVVTDDASSDGTPDIVRSIVDSRIRLEILPRNVGISRAMNATIARARGAYLAILNSDDFALPDRLRFQVAFLDAQKDVAALFGQIQAVNEASVPTAAFNDFSIPLRLPDFSQKSWLRQFFLAGNCVCAPTAMIRREAYAKVGLYDTRMHNLQDFDMWVRMVIAGYNLHVSSEALSAFRIRDDHMNASAPTMENAVRSWFEFLHVLDHFSQLPPAVVFDAFEDLVDKPCTRSQELLGRLALQAGHPPHQFFGLRSLFEMADDEEECAELRWRMGTHDVFGVQARQRIADAG